MSFKYDYSLTEFSETECSRNREDVCGMFLAYHRSQCK